MMAARYEPVRTVSFNISSWIPMRRALSKKKVYIKYMRRFTEVCVRVRIAASGWQIGGESCEEQVKRDKDEYGTRGHDDALVSGGHARCRCSRC